MNSPCRDADLRAHAKLAAISKLRRRVVQDDRAVYATQELFSGRRITRDNTFRVP